MKLICAIVGKARNAFVVNINEDARVSALMDVVWNRGQGVITGPFLTMQLFLAKTANNVWLDVATAASVRVDDTGEEAVMPNEHGDPNGFVWMDPTLALKDPKYFGEDFEPGYGEIHVLVVISTSEPVRKKQKLEEEVSMEDLWRFSELELEESLPDVDHLKKFLQRPLLFRLTVCGLV